MTGAEDDRLDLARNLATRAGMLFEDASVKVILTGKLGADELRSRIQETQSMMDRANSFLRATEALLAADQDGDRPQDLTLCPPPSPALNAWQVLGARLNLMRGRASRRKVWRSSPRQTSRPHKRRDPFVYQLLLGIGFVSVVAWQAEPQMRSLWMTSTSTPEERRTIERSAYYRNCDAARAAGAAPIYRGEPGYRAALDRDGDGIACEPWRGRR